MLRIAKLTDYAMLIMSQMAKEPNTVLSATFLADALRLSPPTVSKVLKILSDANLVSSVRGAEGGYHLAKPAANITLADVLAAMEGGIAMTECCEGVGFCGIESVCTIRENWNEINKLVHGLLSNLSICDMLKPLSLKGLP